MLPAIFILLIMFTPSSSHSSKSDTVIDPNNDQGIQLFSGAVFTERRGYNSYTSVMPLNFVMSLERPDLTAQSVDVEGYLAKDEAIIAADIAKQQTRNFVVNLFAKEPAKNTTHIPRHVLPQARSRRFIGDLFGRFAVYCCRSVHMSRITTLNQNQKTNFKLLKQVKKLTNVSHSIIAAQTFLLEHNAKETEKAIQHLKVRASHSAQHLKDFHRRSQEVQWRSDALYYYIGTNIIDNNRFELALLHSIELNQIQDACLHGKLNEVMVPVSLLTTSLQNLQQVIEAKDHKLAIPIYQIHRYYDFTNCQCVNNGTHITVTLRVPILPIDMTPVLLNTFPVPFQYKNQTCQYFTTKHVAVSINRNLLVLQGEDLDHCSPLTHGLCLLPRLEGPANILSSCLTAIRKNLPVSQLNEVCTLVCRDTNLNRLHITPLTDTSLLVSNSHTDLFVKCDKSNYRLTKAFLNKPGGHLLHLPCDCTLSAEDNIIVPLLFPCDTNSRFNFSFTHILPSVWTKHDFSFVRSHHLEKDLRSHETFVDEQWFDKIPHINITNAVTKNVISQITSQVLEHSSYSLFIPEDNSFFTWEIVMMFSINIICIVLVSFVCLLNYRNMRRLLAKHVTN